MKILKKWGQQSDCDRNLLSLEIPFQLETSNDQPQPQPIPSPSSLGGIQFHLTVDGVPAGRTLSPGWPTFPAGETLGDGGHEAMMKALIWVLGIRPGQSLVGVKHSQAREDGGAKHLRRQEERRIDEGILVLGQTHGHWLRGTETKLKEERSSPDPPPARSKIRKKVQSSPPRPHLSGNPSFGTPKKTSRLGPDNEGKYLVWFVSVAKARIVLGPAEVLFLSREKISRFNEGSKNFLPFARQKKLLLLLGGKSSWPR